MKILQINASYKPAYLYGGPTMSVAKLSEELVKAGCTVEVFTTTANGDNELPVKPNIKTTVDGVNVTYFKRLTKDHTHLSPTLLKNLWKQAAMFDVVHIHAWWNLVSVFSALIALIKKVPMVISPRGTLSTYSFNNKNTSAKSVMNNLLGKRLLTNSYIHATSDAESKALAGIFTPKSVFVVPNFVHIPPLQSKVTAASKGILRLLFFSRIEEKKGLDILLHALPAINSPYHLTIAGDGDETYIEKLKKITRAYKTDINISWIGFQNENKFNILSDHDLLILPSHNENFGNVVIESLSMGTPVLISEHVGLATYVLKNNFGWVCETTVASVSNFINHIAANTPQITHIKNIAPAIIHHDFNEGTLVKQYIDMYRQVIAHD
ncbi:MAG TPA: glycosyltransferase [Mucilaginibacter sp.]|nr:glycosyltransferase [Mucilaginibacter sp.]